MSAKYSKWDRYLDTHIGIQFAWDETTSTDEDVCETYAKAAAILKEGDWTYTQRADHLYVANPGLRSWEFNMDLSDTCAYLLMGDYDYVYTNNCGCISENNAELYKADTGKTCVSMF